MSAAALADLTFDVVAKTTVSRAQVADLLVAAFEGGSTYWVAELVVDDFKGYEWAHEAIAAGSKFAVVSHEDGSTVVEADQIAAAVTLFAEKYPRHFGDMIAETGDAETGDIFFQLLCFGEVIYG